MFRGFRVLVMISLLVAAGCGGDGPTPGLVFPDGATEPGEDVVRPEDTGGDGVGDAAADTAAPDTAGDTAPPPECDTDEDCAGRSQDPCSFWFCHPTQKSCKPATYADGSPCDDGDVCTVGDVCADGACQSGAVVAPPDPWDDPCNVLDCDPEDGWHPVPVVGPCDDGDPCTVDDLCHAGACSGGKDICTEPHCGDGVCQDLEHCESCPQDCGGCETDCCDGHESKGCNDKACEEIICGQDVFCCNQQWDDICAQDAVQFCAICGGGSTCGDGACDFGEDCQSCPVDCDGGCASDCCFIHPGDGCQAEACQDKVCEEDEFCCTEGWDAYCVSRAQEICGLCQ
jgi:hypothetical protein